jgi:acyl-CoA reductase-like NAD-dependent aldehyde dehydrogenase
MSSQHDRANAPAHIRSRIGDAWHVTDRTTEIRNPYNGSLVAHMPISTAADCDAALDAATKAKNTMAALPGYERANILRRAADMVVQRAEDIALAMTLETGKALSDSRGETVRSAETLRLCAEEAVRIQGEHVPMEASAIGAGKIGMTLRFPVGVVSAITPFNAPINLAAHKLGSVIAAANVAVLKPSPKAPLTVHKFVEVLIEAGLPHGALNVLYGDDIATQIVTDPRVDFVTFTGSTRVGKLIRASAGMRGVTLELGGIGPTIVHDDADLAAAARACARNSMLLAGQSCVSVQNVFVHRGVAEQFTKALTEEVALIRVGDPMDPKTEVGTLIDAPAVNRVAGMVQDAVKEGARIVRGGSHRAAVMEPTILADVSPKMRVVSEEIFGPAVTVQVYDDVMEVFASISNSPYGLQCGVYTKSLSLALQAVRSVRTGGVIVNGTSRWRSDQMPYGGVKDSGIGREGPKYAIRDMTESRFFVLN